MRFFVCFFLSRHVYGTINQASPSESWSSFTTLHCCVFHEILPRSYKQASSFLVFLCSLPCRQSWVNIAFTLESPPLSSFNTLGSCFQLYFSALTPEELLVWRQLQSEVTSPNVPASAPSALAAWPCCSDAFSVDAVYGLNGSSALLCCRCPVSRDSPSQAQCCTEHKTHRGFGSNWVILRHKRRWSIKSRQQLVNMLWCSFSGWTVTIYLRLVMWPMCSSSAEQRTRA